MLVELVYIHRYSEAGMSEFQPIKARWRPFMAAGLVLTVGGTVAATHFATTANATPRTAAGAKAASVTAVSAKKQKLIGTFSIKAGTADGKKVSGSYLRMVTPNGHYLANPSSSAVHGSYTLITPGTDKGLETGKYQPEPSPAFDSNGNALASRIFKPVKFEGVGFSGATAKVDPQTNTSVPAPSIAVSGHKLTGNLAAFAVSWSKQQFNQGSPKPGGTYPGATTHVTGTYNPKTHAFSLTWRSEIVGGPFNSFSGLWHLAGTFHAA
jgi:hypothetical protein